MRLGPADSDFVVDEIPLYPPSGEGEHLHLRIRSSNCSTPALAQALAACCGVAVRDIGYAGRKDRHAVTSQDLSVYRGQEAQITALAKHLPPGAEAEVLSLSRHRNKLRPGHLRGNRFRLRLLDVAQPEELTSRLVQCQSAGIPNSYGPQRYGRDGINLRQALACAGGEIGKPRRRDLATYWADAGQAAIFDACIQARFDAGLLQALRVGDVAIKGSGACFVVSAEALADCQERLEQGELGCSGPLPGADLLLAAAGVNEEERAWSASVGIDWQAFARGGPLASRGDRRPAAMELISAPQLQLDGASQGWLHLELGRGSYATSFCQHLGIDINRGARM